MKLRMMLRDHLGFFAEIMRDRGEASLWER